MQRSASALKTAGNDIDESIAMIAAANEIVQDPEQVGNGMKTIALRLVGNKKTLEELGEETDNVVESTSELNKKMEETAGISITDKNGELKSTYQILDELYAKWDKLSSLQQAELTDTLAGKNRANIFSALMQNWDKAKEAFNVSANESVGSAEKEMDKALNSIEAKMNQLKATGQSISVSFLNSDSVKQFLDIIIKIGSALDGIIKKFGAIPTVIGTITAALSAFKDKGLIKQGDVKSIFTGISNKTDNKSIITSGFTSSLESDIAAINKFNEAVSSGQNRSQAFSDCLSSASNSAKAYVKSFSEGAVSTERFSKNMVSAQVSLKSSQKGLGAISSVIKEYNSNCKQTGLAQKDFVSAVSQGNSSLGTYLSGLNGAKASMTGYVGSMIAAKAASIGLQVATAALNMAITMGISMAISGAISLISKWVNAEKDARASAIETGEAAKESASNIVELYNAYSSASEAYKSNTGSKEDLASATDSLLSALGYEESEIESLVNKYDDLDTAINNVTQKALQKEISNLSTGYTSAGEDFYKKAKDAGNEIIYDKSAFSILKKNGFNIENPDYSGKIVIDFGELWDANDAEKEFQTLLDMRQTLYDAAKNGDISLEDNAAFDSLNKIINDLEDSEGKFFSFREELNKSVAKDQYFDFIKNNDIPKSQEEFDSLRQSMIEASEENKLYVGTQEDINNAITNTLSNIPELSRFIKETASDTDDAIKVTQSQIKAIRDSFKKQGKDSLGWFDSLSAGDKRLVYKISAETDDTALWDLTKWSEELNYLKETGETTSESLSKFYDVMNNSEDGNFKSQIESNIDTITSLQESIDKLDLGELSDTDLANLAMNYPELAPYINDTDLLRDSIEELIDKTESGLDTSFSEQIEALGGESTAAGQAMLELQKAIQAINDTPFDISKETQGIENYKTAVNESVSATGLSEDSIKKVQARYRGLESYNPNKLFERTVNGIHLNVSALRELESEYKKQKKTDLTSQLEDLSKEYNTLVGKIENCTDASRKIEYAKQLDNLAEQINSVSQLASEYDGLTSSYNEWLNAQSTTDEDDMYSKISNSIEDMQEQFDLGRVGTDDFRSWVQMMTNADMSTSSVAELESMYEKGTATIQRFFTDDREGLENFVNDVKTAGDKLGKSWINIDKDGNYHIDFGVGGDEEVANALSDMENLQISTQQVQILMRALSAYGFDINLDSLNTATSTLDEANDKLKQLGKTTVDFNFNTTDIDDVNQQIQEAQKILDSFKNSDGSINMSADGAEDAVVVLSNLMRLKQTLEAPLIMGVSLQGVDTDVQPKLNALKEFIQNDNNYQIDIAVGADTTEAQQKLQAYASVIQSMPSEMKAKLGLDDADFQQALANISNTKLSVGAQLNSDDIATVRSTISSISSDQIVSVGVDESAVKSYTATPEGKDIIAKTDVDSTAVDNYKPSDKTAKVLYTPNLTAIYNMELPTKYGEAVYNVVVNGDVPSASNTKSSKKGGAKAKGTAYAQGNWGTKDSGTALGGELGEEILVRDGRWQTIGENGAEFFKYQRGDIIFNAEQTEQILKYGKITSGRKRGASYADGTAFSSGSGSFGRSTKKKDKSNSNTKSDSKSSSKSSNSNSSPSSSKASSDNAKEAEKEAEKFEETLDWIEIMIDRIENAVSSLDDKVGSIYRKWSYRNKDLTKEISMIGNEMNIQQAGYDRYIKQANLVGLSEDWAKKVRDGKIDIETITDENLNNKIKDYQNWYNKAVECKKTIEELKETESSLYKQAFDNVTTEFGYYTSHVDSLKSHIESIIAQEQSKGYAVSKTYYQELLGKEQANLTTLKAQRNEMQAAFDKAIDSGKIQKYSEAWYQMRQGIDEVNAAIDKSNETTLEYIKNIRQLKWDTNDLIHDTINDLSNESDYLIKLIEDKKQYDDRGQLTDYGDTTMGLHVANYDIYYGSSLKYAKEIENLDKQIKRDGANKDLINRRKELIELQQESILAAQQEKQSIVDMVKEGIELELDYLQDLIDKYGDALDSQKDLYDYQQKISSHTSEISTLEKQLMAYQGDNSEETKATIQKLKVSLDEAKQNLKDTEYDRYISGQKELLSNIYDEYEDILNARLDNIDSLMQDMVDDANNNTEKISNVIKAESEKFGYNISSWFSGIFNDREIDGNSYRENQSFSYYEYGDNKKDAIYDKSNGKWGTSVAAMLNLISGYQNAISEMEDRLRSVYNGDKKKFNDDLQNYIPTISQSTIDSIEKSLSSSIISGNMQEKVLGKSTANGVASVSGINNAKNNQNVMNGDVDFNVTLPNVTNYDQFKKELQHDKGFEKMVMSMTTDKLFGGSSLGKFKTK